MYSDEDYTAPRYRVRPRYEGTQNAYVQLPAVTDFTLPTTALSLNNNNGRVRRLYLDDVGVGESVSYALENARAAGEKLTATPDSDGRIRSLITQVSGQGSYYIKVCEGCTYDLTLYHPSNYDNPPNVFIFLDSGATLNLYDVYSPRDGDNLKLFVCGGADTVVNIEGDSDTLTVKGAISAGQINVDCDFTLDYYDPPAGTVLADGGSGGGSGGTGTVWSFEEYESD